MANNPQPLALRCPSLSADIGGTNARFGIVCDACAEPKTFAWGKTADYDNLELRGVKATKSEAKK